MICRNFLSPRKKFRAKRQPDEARRLRWMRQQPGKVRRRIWEPLL